MMPLRLMKYMNPSLQRDDGWLLVSLRHPNDPDP